jgi:hypothetical protein
MNTPRWNITALWTTGLDEGRYESVDSCDEHVLDVIVTWDQPGQVYYPGRVYYDNASEIVEFWRRW